MQEISYPVIYRDNTVVEDLHGHRVADPYRWLEDTSSQATAEVIKQQNRVMLGYLKRVEHLRPRFKASIEQLLSYDSYSAPFQCGPFYYHWCHAGLDDQPVLMQARAMSGIDPVRLIDPNTMTCAVGTAPGTVSIGVTKWSPDGAFVAYGVKHGGGDWQYIRVRDCWTRLDLDETLEWAKIPSIAWSRDGHGFYYTRYPAPSDVATEKTVNQAIYYHELDTPQAQDRFVYADPAHPSRMFDLRITDDGKYLVLNAFEDCAVRNQVFLVDIDVHTGSEMKHLIRWIDTSCDAQFEYITNNSDEFYFLTNWDAPRFRVIRATLGHSLRDAHIDVVPEGPDVLSIANAVDDDKIALVYMRHAHDALSIHNLRSGAKLFDVPLPDLGSVSLKAERKNSFLTFRFTSFLHAGTVFHVNFKHQKALKMTNNMELQGKNDCYKVTELCCMNPPGFDPSQYITRQVFYTSRDGSAQVPMFVIHPRADLEFATPPKRPTLLYGYGGFMASETPHFTSRWAAWLQLLGGTVAVANIRGGGEYGSKWHASGCGSANKQNTFDDFQCAAIHLIEDLRITSADSLMVLGGSHGGTVVSACCNQAPHLFGAAVAQVGVHDLVRFHKFTVGAAWKSEFGDPECADDLPGILKMSPLHNVFSPDERGVAYPAMLLTTGDCDERVVPLHSLKMAAELQHVAGQCHMQNGRPLLVRVGANTGHGCGNAMSKKIDELCDTLLFAARALELDLSCSSPSVSAKNGKS